MAGAYGGSAIGQIKRPGVKYDKDRLQDSKKFRINPNEEPALRAHLSSLVKSNSRADNLQQNSLGSGSRRGSVQRAVGRDSASIGSTDLNHIRKRQQMKKAGMKDGDFEDLFGKDID